jgi:hypothetical protein
VLVLGCGVAGVMLWRSDPKPKPIPQALVARSLAQTPLASVALVPAPATAVQPTAVDMPSVSPDTNPPTEVQGLAGSARPATSTPAARVPAAGDPPASDQLAREALGWVGADPEAEEYWLEAINDPRLPAEERRNLIEDLNEDGLPDPKHPTLDDLPLLVNRIRLIEDMAPYAMDQVNLDAFAEAYKDLVNLVELAQGRGEPVR